MATTEDVQEMTASERMLVAADEFWFKIESAMNLLAAFFIFGIMLLGVAQVIGRSIFNQPVRGYVDIVEVSITVFAFLAISYCQRLAGHVRMEIIIGRFKGRALWLTETFGTIVIMFIVFVLMLYAWDHFMRAWSIGDSSIDVEITLWPSKLLVPLAFAMLTVRLTIQLIGFLRLVAKPNATPIGIPEMETVEKAAQEEIKAGLGGDMEGVILPTVETTKDAK
ncbi:MAG: TRAP transporter small permease [Alphaproteobacteria bacterium]|jgi:C4-dicarboxylate transporter, DctQ subunit|nr:TRAP transporter small permease [Alphaproteobacteria bacterium]